MEIRRRGRGRGVGNFPRGRQEKKLPSGARESGREFGRRFWEGEEGDFAGVGGVESDGRGEVQAGVVEVEAVHELVVVVPGGGVVVAGEGGDVGAFEVDEAAVLLVEEGVVAGVVEGVVGVGGDLAGVDPGAFGGGGLGEPDFAEEGGFAEGLDAGHDPGLAVGVPGDGGAVGLDGVAGFEVSEGEEGFWGSRAAGFEEVLTGRRR